MTLHIRSHPRHFPTHGGKNPNVNHGLDLVPAYQYWVISYNKYSTLRQDFRNKGDSGGQGWELSVVLAQFSYKPKTLL